MKTPLLGTLAALFAALPSPAQQPVDGQDAKVAAAAEQWLTSDHADPDLLERTVKALMVDAPLGIAWLGRNLPGALQQPALARSKGTLALATQVALEFLRRQQSSDAVYAGQYDGLKPLLPFVADLFFGYLLDTPTWFPDTHRITLVPALRDLQPNLPAPDRTERLIALAENPSEPDGLRLQLGCMLWQWGKKQFVQPQLDRLQRESAEGDAEDRVRVLLELADLQYQLRDYKAAAATHRSLHSLAVAANVVLKPTDWYASACVQALIGNVDRGIEDLQKCAELQASPHVDSSHKLRRATFEKDPEIEVLRRDSRYAAIFAKAFGGKPPNDTRGR